MGARVRFVLALAVISSACGGGGTQRTGDTTPAAPAAAPETAASAPIRRAGSVAPARLIDTVDSGHSDVKIAVHAAAILDGTPCWTFVTHGLDAYAQPELVLSVTMRESDSAAAYPSDAMLILANLADAAAKGEILPWWSGTAAASFFGRKDLVGLAAVPAEGPQSLELPARALAILVLTAAETDLARAHGAARVAAMLGRYYRFYPTAWWLDRDRPSVVTPAQVASSQLHGTSGVRIQGMTTVFEMRAAPELAPVRDATGLPNAVGKLDGSTLHVRVAPTAAPEVARSLRTMKPNDAVLALLGPDELAGGRFVWVPGSDRAEVITGPGFTGRITGSFLALAIDPGGTRASLVEDGALLMITPAQRDAIATALDGGRTYQQAGTADSLAWTFGVVAPKPTGPGSLTAVFFETPMDVVSRRSSVGDVAAFVQAVEREMAAAIATANPTAPTAVVRVVLLPGKRDVTVTPSVADTGAWVAEVERRIDALPTVVVTGEVALRATFALR